MNGVREWKDGSQENMNTPSRHPEMNSPQVGVVETKRALRPVQRGKDLEQHFAHIVDVVEGWVEEALVHGPACRGVGGS